MSILGDECAPHCETGELFGLLEASTYPTSKPTNAFSQATGY